MRTDWMQDAACAGSELDFYEFTRDNAAGEQGDPIDWEHFGALVAICTTRCRVLRECATFAMREGAVEQHGCWAGTTGAERMKVRHADDPVQAVIDQCRENLAKAKQHAAQMRLEGVA